MNPAFMRRAIELSRNGFPAPNPHVGCVIVQNGQIVGEGFHDHWGGPHAEVVALRQAGENSSGSDVYVTLEPCSHHGRTPPCAEALIAAKVSRVFVATADPNPIASRGAEVLRNAGIPVEIGIMAEKAVSANLQFMTAFKLGRPFVVAKAAIGLDGRIALDNGKSKWITGELARKESHRLRAEAGCVLVGCRTVLADDPELTARIPNVVNQPIRVIIDPNHRLTGRERVFNDAAETVHISQPFGSLEDLLAELWDRKIRGILVEGGASTISRFVEAELVDRVELFMAPKILGSGPAWTSTRESAAEIPPNKFVFVQSRQLGTDKQISLINPNSVATR